jgi:hypothetical protein
MPSKYLLGVIHHLDLTKSAFSSLLASTNLGWVADEGLMPHETIPGITWEKLESKAGEALRASRKQC